MNYSNLEEIQKHLQTLDRVAIENAYLPGEFTPVMCNQFVIYLSGGKSSFSNPQLNFKNILDYDSLQIVIREIIKDDAVDICPLNDDRFKNFIWAKYFTYIGRLGTSLPSYMGAYVPQKDVLQLIHEVYRVSRLRIFF